MTDRPIAARIRLTLTDKQGAGEEFISLSGTLYRQNLIFAQPQELRENENNMELTVIFRDKPSFDGWIENPEIVKFWTPKFEHLLQNKAHTVEEENTIIKTDHVFNCTCNKSNFYILQGRSLQFADELTCNNCLGQIAYSRVPLEIAIEDWQTKYQRVYLTWLESGLFEKESLQELKNYKSGKLNLAGERIRIQLSDRFRVPVYILYFSDNYEDNIHCVICGQQGIESGLLKPNLLCKTCNTIWNDKSQL